MKFLTPAYLWLLPALAVFAAVLAIVSAREYRRRLALFVAERLRTPLQNGRALREKRLRLAATTLGLLALAMALARPLGGSADTAAHRRGVNLLVAIDGSRSMLAEDVAPSRFALGQAGISSLLRALQGDRAGLMLFSGQATLMSPLTFDTVSLELINRSLDPEFAGRGGTSIAEAIRRATEYFKDKPWSAKVLLVISDGEETDGDALLAAQEAWQKSGIRIFTAGVGTAGGATIPRLERNARRELVRAGVVRDAKGNEVRSRLDARLLRGIAEAAGGSYVDLDGLHGNLREFYDAGLRPLATSMDEVPLRDRVEWFQLPLAVALALFALEALWPPGRVKGAGIAAVAMLTLESLLSPAARADEGDAAKLFAEGNYAAAFEALQQEALAQPDDPRVRYNYAIGAYAAGRFAVAAETFEKLAGSAPPEIAARSRAQRGNSLFRQGEAMGAANPEGAAALWEKACAAFAQAPDVPLAVHNEAVVRTALTSLFQELAVAREKAGDEAGRLSGEQAIPLWAAAGEFLDRGLRVAADDTARTPLAARRLQVSGKIFSAYRRSAQDKARRAEFQKASSLERALDLLEDAVGDYTKALEQRPDDAGVIAEKNAAAAQLTPWRIERAEQLHAAGFAARPVALEQAISHWQKAAPLYARALADDAGNAAATQGQAKNNAALHDGYVELGDRRQVMAEGLPPAERDAMFEEALGLYQAALALQPANAATREKLAALGRRLSAMFARRGREELEQGKVLVPAKPAEAIAWVERAVQSFGQALRFEPERTDAAVGKKEAEELLRRLREQDAGEQRRMQGQGKNLTDPKDLEEPGKLALKLLDYKTDQLASRKQQNISAPENKPTKDW